MPELDAFQHEVIDFMRWHEGRVIYADPMGARKTGTTLSYLAQALPRATLIIAPKSVHGHWEREGQRFNPGSYIARGSGTAKQRAAALALTRDDWMRRRTYITTYESMKQDEREIIAAGFDCVVFDEGHRLKGRRTAVALTANAVTRNAKQVIIATGTPVLNAAEELWQYLHMLDRRTYKSFWAWAEEHFVITLRQYRGNRFVTRLIGDFKPGHEEIVKAQLAPYLIQRDIADLFPGEAWVLEPEHVVIPVDLSPRERKAYDDLVKRGWTQLDKMVQADNKLALSTRLQQLSSDWGTLDDSADDGTKVTAAAELIADLARRESIVVFTKFVETANRLAAVLRTKKVSALPYHGGLDSAKRDDVIERFKAGTLQVVVGTLAALGEGVDGLQHHGSTVVMLDRDWTDARNQQAIGRRRRSGQDKRVTVYHVIATNTIDEAVVAACLRKVNVVELLAGKPLSAAVYGTGIEIEPV